jgi:hypothetical protein
MQEGPGDQRSVQEPPDDEQLNGDDDEEATGARHFGIPGEQRDEVEERDRHAAGEDQRASG